MRNKSHFYINKFSHILNFVKNNFLIYNFLFINKNKKSQFFNFITLYKSILITLFWIKIRVLYYVNNWIYTTNHKRIAVNYFWFVILSGIVGMVLATLIRLEFAYPGVGIFAGDSLQYLSMATAHGVIMVFFMIMPLLFGAFANFLIPTQLGVHDVAFPRLNSAAFWFLPGGLLMLCQLVCIDRRYQRMNCFNIREIQSLLKRKFFTDLINSHDHRTLLDKTAMGLRFKTNNVNLINNNMFIFYNYGIEFTSKIRTNNFTFNNENLSNTNTINSNSINYLIIKLLSQTHILSLINNLYLSLINNLYFISNFNIFFKNFFNLIIILNSNIYESLNAISIFFLNSFYNFFSIVSNLIKTPSSVLNLLILSPFYLISFIFNLIITIFYNNLNLLNSLTNLKLNYNEMFNFNLSLSTLFKEFFFIINFFEIFYYYMNSNLNINYGIYLFNNTFFLNMFNFNLKYVFQNNLFNFKNYPQTTTSIKTNLTNKIFENNFISSNHNFSKSQTFFNNSFYAKLDYNSYYVYIYIIIYIILNSPFFIFNFIKNIFNFDSIIKSFYNFYEFIIFWYLPTLLNDNPYYFFYKNLNINLSLTSNSLLFQIYIINFFNLLNSMINISLFNFNFIEIITINALNINIIMLNTFNLLFNNLSYLINSIIKITFSNNTNTFFIFLYKLPYIKFFSNPSTLSIDINSNYSSNYFNNLNNSFLNKYDNEENSNGQRYLKFYNPIFKYDYKSGDYFPKLYKTVYNSLFVTISELTSTVRTAQWFLSDKYTEAFMINFSNYFDNIIKSRALKNSNVHSWNSSRFNNTDAFYNFFFILSNDSHFTNKKWISLNVLNQKFYKMFNTSSMQQRIYSNWRQLKFTREAWRCKLLAARHQKTLFRRYVNEDGVFWSIERNAKDLLPGWAMITPFSSRTRFTAVGKTDIGLMGVFLVLNSSIISGANFLVTYRYLSTLNNRKMRDARVFFTESIIVACWMMIFANPMLSIAILMLLSDRHWQTSFFDYSGGGDTVLFQHMFWFFGHPEVYVIVIPTFGFTNTMISYYLRKRVSARASLLYSMYTIAFLGFFVWGHHMYMVGLAHTTRMLFSTLTVMISVPAATKIMHWCVTTVNSSIALELPLLFTFTFIFLFVSGGISGMCVAHTGMDVLFHDTFYVIGHFHVMLAGAAMFGSFGAFYFYFPAIFGVKYSRIYAYLHYVYYLLGQLMTVIPMFWLGYAGMPRRVLDYPASMGGWHSVISAGHLLSVAGLIAFFIMIFDSLRQGRAVTRNTFGISRYNTRLNFYLYEISRITYVQQKGLFFFRFVKPTSIKLNNLNYLNIEPLETTLISYVIFKK